MKEPGQLAYENSGPATLWRQLDDINRARFARIESAIRADESAKIIEECAKLCEEGVDEQHPIIRSHTMEKFHKSAALAAAIRALGEKKDG